MFELPEEWEEFCSDMHNRAIKYIRINHWDIAEDDFLLWYKNFDTNHEKFLAAIIIYRIIYRNKLSILSMYQYIIDLIIPKVLKNNSIHIGTMDDFHKTLERGYGSSILFSTIENIDQGTGKSGSTILRDFARYGSFHNDLKVSAEKLKDVDRNKNKVIVLFDDIMGTGEQFNTFLEKFYLDTEELILLYCPLAATTIALESFDYIKYPRVIIEPVEKLDTRYNFFNEEFMPKIIENIDINNLIGLYERMMKQKTKLKKGLMGRGDLGLTYIFSVSTPNNTLPILFYNDDLWNHLVPR